MSGEFSKVFLSMEKTEVSENACSVKSRGDMFRWWGIER